MKRVLNIIAALIFGLIGLGMSLCGGGFSFSILLGIAQNGRKDYAGFLVFALPCALIGIVLMVVCSRILLQKSREKD